MWFLQIIRTFFFALDNVLFNFIPTVYDLLITISRTTILSQGQIKAFSDRIQMLLGVFMIFKVAFSLITYIINPDEFSDKGKGFGKLWQNIVISLILLVLTPYAFDLAYKFQGMVLEDNTLATLILGTSEGDIKNTYINTAGQNMAYTIMLPFFLPDTSNSALVDCSSLINENGDANEECFSAMYKAIDKKGDVDPLIENYKLGIENNSLGLTFRLDIAKKEIKNTTADSDGNVNSGFLINYMAPLSTVVAVVVLLLLITFCMDVALRSVKLAFLQLISPIPIISFIDPKSGKDGMFKKWYQMCFQTYISLFVRFIALYFGIYIISKVGAMYDIVNGSRVDDFWVKIFVIIGVLMFIKQLPKILEGFGFKLDGDGKFELNPFKKLEDQAVGGKRILATAGAVGAAGAALGTNLIAAKGIRKPFSAIAGATSALGRGLVGAVKGEKFSKNFSTSYSGAMRARQNRDDRRELGVNSLEVTSEKIKQSMGISTTSQIQDSQVKRYEEAINAGKAAKTRAESEVDKRADSIQTSFGVSLGTLRDKVENLKNVNAKEYADAHGIDLENAAAEIAKLSSKANSDYFSARKKATESYLKHAAAGTLSSSANTDLVDDTGHQVFTNEDINTRENINMMQSAVDKYKLKDANNEQVKVNPEKLGDSIQTLEDAKIHITSSDEFRKAHLIADQTKKQK